MYTITTLTIQWNTIIVHINVILLCSQITIPRGTKSLGIGIMPHVFLDGTVVKTLLISHTKNGIGYYTIRIGYYTDGI